MTNWYSFVKKTIFEYETRLMTENYTTKTLAKNVAKCHFLYTIQILGWNILPQKLRSFQQYQIGYKAAKAIKYYEIDSKELKYT